MWKNKRFIGVAIIAVWAGLMNADGARATQLSSEFEGRLEFFKPLAVGMTAGTADDPELVRIEWIRFNRKYANAWGVTARVGWLPVRDATWRLMIELLDDDGRVLRHSRDESTVLRAKLANEAKQTCDTLIWIWMPCTIRGADTRHGFGFVWNLQKRD